MEHACPLLDISTYRLSFDIELNLHRVSSGCLDVFVAIVGFPGTGGLFNSILRLLLKWSYYCTQVTHKMFTARKIKVSGKWYMQTKVNTG